ncbi:SGNH/GDSL hydrolase family protein [Spirosoma validum]|uniref:SGNH/GDSL hydrolase family protein n=1 Tax=Spirosoma validum TaxID=2771355 RepID=A0A927GBB1_9BACT|nr:SGNH/GDSL hydrolase family protein [Spirosoma validum]MBD2751523.1 SGNH/GDSL hydrolase family protein [Spirosoma validum]
MQVYTRLRWGVIVTTLVSLIACTTNDIDPNGGNGETPSKGNADFTKYVAVGNSLTAGFADGGLYRDSQLNAYPNILAGQFKTVGGGDFIQPLFAEAQAAGSGYMKLVQVPDTTNPISLISAIKQVAPGAVRVTNTNGSALFTKFTGANQNLGVPGIKMGDILLQGYGSTQGNPYFERLLGDADQATTYFQYVSNNLTGATFFSCWLGNNDVLSYATSGGVSALTPSALFTTNYTAMMNKLTEGGRKGVVIGIPNITIAPYFRLITLSVINRLFKVLAPGTPDLPALAIQASDAPQGVRASTANDLFLLSLANQTELTKFGRTDVGTKVGRYGLDATNPLPTTFVLDAGEIATMNARIAEFNGVMKTQADAKGVAYVDPNTVLTQLASATGLQQNGIKYTAAFIQGGAFSLDGIHLTPAGYALIANEIIKGINAKYASTVPQVNPANYHRVLLQQ